MILTNDWTSTVELQIDKDFFFIKRVLKSCTEPEQLDAIEKLIRLFYDRYENRNLKHQLTNLLNVKKYQLCSQ